MLAVDNPDIYSLLIEVCKPYGVDPSASIDAEEFFRNLLSAYDGFDDATIIAAWMDDQVSRNFVSLSARPRWIQECERAYHEGRPMIFVGQIDLNQAERERVVPTLYHDDTSFYLFVARARVPPVVVMQQY